MIYRDVCGEKLSRLGMGNMRLPTKGEGMGAPIDEEKAQAIIDFVYAGGVNYFDTAYMYHGGKSEGFVGKALKKYPRDSFFLATKMPSNELEKEILHNYLRSQDIQLDRLYAYAKTLHCEKIIRTYLEVLI